MSVCMLLAFACYVYGFMLVFNVLLLSLMFCVWEIWGLFCQKKLHLMIGLDKGRICWGCCALLSVHGVVSLLHPLVARFIAFCERLFGILFRNLWGDPEICSIQQEIDWMEWDVRKAWMHGTGTVAFQNQIHLASCQKRNVWPWNALKTWRWWGGRFWRVFSSSLLVRIGFITGLFVPSKKVRIFSTTF